MYIDDLEDNIAEADKQVEKFYDWFVANGGIKAYDLNKWITRGVVEKVEVVSELSPLGMYLAIDPYNKKLESSYLCQYNENGFRGKTDNTFIVQRGENNHRWSNWKRENYSYDVIQDKFTGWNKRVFYKINDLNKPMRFMNWKSNPFNN